jgi:hypothetical protein
MKPIMGILSGATLILACAAPVLGAKPVRPADSTPRPQQQPKGIEVAQEHASSNAGKGHGDDVPRGNGNGYGHEIHDHSASPD